MTTVLPENALTLVILGVAFWKSEGKFLILLCILTVVMHMGLDWALTKEFPLDLEVVDDLTYKIAMYNNISYYWLTSLFFLAMFGLFFLQITKLSIWLSGFMLAQCVLCFLMAINGAEFKELSIPEFEIIYLLHSTFNDTIWVVECIIAWIAATSSRD